MNSKRTKTSLSGPKEAKTLPRFHKRPLLAKQTFPSPRFRTKIPRRFLIKQPSENYNVYVYQHAIIHETAKLSLCEGEKNRAHLFMKPCKSNDHLRLVDNVKDARIHVRYLSTPLSHLLGAN